MGETSRRIATGYLAALQGHTPAPLLVSHRNFIDADNHLIQLSLRLYLRRDVDPYL